MNSIKERDDDFFPQEIKKQLCHLRKEHKEVKDLTDTLLELEKEEDNEDLSIYNIISALYETSEKIMELENKDKNIIGYFLVCKLLQLQWKNKVSMGTAMSLYTEINRHFSNCLTSSFYQKTENLSCWTDDMLIAMKDGFCLHSDPFFLCFVIKRYLRERKNNNALEFNFIVPQSTGPLFNIMKTKPVQALCQKVSSQDKNFFIERFKGSGMVYFKPNTSAEEFARETNFISHENLPEALYSYSCVHNKSSNEDVFKCFQQQCILRTDLNEEHKKTLLCNLAKWLSPDKSPLMLVYSACGEKVTDELFPSQRQNCVDFLTKDLFKTKGLKHILGVFNILGNTDMLYRFFDVIDECSQQEINTMMGDAFVDLFDTSVSKDEKTKAMLTDVFVNKTIAVLKIASVTNIGLFISKENNKSMMNAVMKIKNDVNIGSIKGENIKERVVQILIKEEADPALFEEEKEHLYKYFIKNKKKLKQLEKFGNIFNKVMTIAMQKKDSNMISFMVSDDVTIVTKRKRCVIELDDYDENDSDYQEKEEKEEKEEIKKKKQKKTRKKIKTKKVKIPFN